MTRHSRALVVDLPPLPETNADFARATALDLNDEVTRMLLNGLYAKNKQYLEAAQNPKAVTGRVVFDRAMAAIITKQFAQDENNSFVANKTVAELDHALNVAMKRIGIGRRQRLLLALQSRPAAE